MESKLNAPMHPNLDPDGYYTGSVYVCEECGYMHRNGPKGPDHGGKEWVLSYALGHRLVDRATKPVTKPRDKRQRDETPLGGEASGGTGEQPSTRTARPCTQRETPEGQSPQTQRGRPSSGLTHAERQAAYRARKKGEA